MAAGLDDAGDVALALDGFVTDLRDSCCSALFECFLRAFV